MIIFLSYLLIIIAAMLFQRLLPLRALPTPMQLKKTIIIILLSLLNLN